MLMVCNHQSSCTRISEGPAGVLWAYEAWNKRMWFIRVFAYGYCKGTLSIALRSIQIHTDMRGGFAAHQTRKHADNFEAPIRPHKANMEMKSGIAKDQRGNCILWVLLSPWKPRTIMACDICSAWLKIFWKTRRIYMTNTSTFSRRVKCCQSILRERIPSATLRTSSKIRLMNLKESIRVRTISATGTSRWTRGSRNQRNADASCSGGVVDKQRLALCRTVKVRHADVLATESPFLVICKGPSLKNI